MNMSYTVIYRTGGTENFKWHKCVPVGSRERAEEQKQEIKRMGYKAIIHKTTEIESIGLPETYNIHITYTWWRSARERGSVSRG